MFGDADEDGENDPILPPAATAAANQNFFVKARSSGDQIPLSQEYAYCTVQ